MEKATKPIPKAVVVIATFLFIATAIAFVVGESLLFPNPLLDRMWQFNKPAAALFHSMGRISGLPLVLLGVGTCSAAVGLLRGRVWAWWFAVILFAVDAMGDVLSFLITGDWLKSAAGLLISSAFLWMLCGRPVRLYLSR